MGARSRAHGVSLGACAPAGWRVEGHRTPWHRFSLHPPPHRARTRPDDTPRRARSAQAHPCRLAFDLLLPDLPDRELTSGKTMATTIERRPAAAPQQVSEKEARQVAESARETDW